MTDLQYNRVHKEVIRLLDGEDSGVSGEASNLESFALLDGSEYGLTISVTEIDSTDPDIIGSYEISWTTPSSGSYLYIRVWHDTYEIAGWDENYRLLSHLQDQSGPGDRTVSITLLDQDTNAPISGAWVSVYNSARTFKVAAAFTNSSGVAEVSLYDGNYKVVPSKIGDYTFGVESLTVSGDTTATYYGDPFAPSTPSTPGLCVVYGWEYDPSGDAVRVKIEVKVMADNRFLTTNPHVIKSKSVYSSSTDGYWELAVTRSDQYTESGVTYKFTIDGKAQGDYSIPAQSSIAFKDLVAS